MTDALQVELKLEVAPEHLDALEAALAAAGFALDHRRQDTTYFDTDRVDLRAAGLSLRIRDVSGRRVQTVKADGAAAAGLFARPEWETDVADDRPVVDEHAAPLRALLPDDILQALGPIFDVRVERRSGEATRDAVRIEAALDMGEVIAGERTDRVAELELELKEGSTPALFALARKLDEAAPLRLGVLTKAERGYRLLDGSADKPAKAAHAIVSGDVTAVDACAAIAAACVRQFRLNQDLLARTGGADALHQARVALRRLRSALSIFKPLLADARFQQFRGELRWIAAILGEARDIDVLAQRGIGVALDEPRAAAYARVAEALGSARTRSLMLDFAEWTAVGAWRNEAARSDLLSQPAARYAAETLDKLRRQLKKRGRRLAELDDEERHEVRIIAKKLRYAAEFFTGLFPDDKKQRRAKRFIAAMEELQEELGKLNDLATAPGVLARLGLAGEPASAAPDRRRLIERAAEAYEDLIDCKRFWR